MEHHAVVSYEGPTDEISVFHFWFKFGFTSSRVGQSNEYTLWSKQPNQDGNDFKKFFTEEKIDELKKMGIKIVSLSWPHDFHATSQSQEGVYAS